MSIGSRMLLLVIFLVGFPAAAWSDEAETMYIQAAALTKLAAAVEATVYRGLPADLSEGVLLDLATRHDPNLLVPFAGFALRARRESDYTSVLLCTEDRSQRLIEDAACTARVDHHFWRDAVVAGCEFEQPLAASCP